MLLFYPSDIVDSYKEPATYESVYCGEFFHVNFPSLTAFRAYLFLWVVISLVYYLIVILNWKGKNALFKKILIVMDVALILEFILTILNGASVF